MGQEGKRWGPLSTVTCGVRAPAPQIPLVHRAAFFLYDSSFFPRASSSSSFLPREAWSPSTLRFYATTESLRKQTFDLTIMWHMRNSEKSLHTQLALRAACLHVCSSVSIALPVTAWRDIASVIGIRKAGPGREMTACGRLLSPGSSGRAITKLVKSTLVQYAACRLLRLTAGQMSQFDSDYSVGDQASPLFFSQVRISLCRCLPWVQEYY